MTGGTRRLVALVDCSAFYCSCEQLFRPELRGRPVVVLSNNDGCVIARSAEAKALGVEMGAPYFKVRDTLERQRVTVFSSNYALYHDLSSRVLRVLERFSPEVERYSIDEAFLELRADAHRPDAERERLDALAGAIRQAVWDATRIPVRVSIAETKTLAKAASEYARTLESQTVCWWGHPDRERFLAAMPVGDVWGVGRRWARRLALDGAPTATGLAALDDGYVRKHYNVVLLRTALELRGVSCLPLSEAPPPRRSLVRSRMFGHALTEAEPIGRAVAMHAATAAAMLRRDGLAASVVEAFVTTGRHGSPVHHGRAVVELPTPTNDTLAIVRAARSLVAPCLVRPGGGAPRFKKAGVMLTGLGPAGEGQTHLFDAPVREHPEMMEALDRISRRFGRGALVVAAQGTPDELRGIHAGAGPDWGMARQHLSPRYTTRWDELPTARIEGPEARGMGQGDSERAPLPLALGSVM
ncbi:Y-family DNA polymerase [Rubrivirga sp. IMCC43871]|uniref:Y-family DNA polymerase n=1 Tax=Rubrivirga sp. IMCC43871 TaxID=3391575 RepID=UPI0039902DE5